MSSNHTTLDNQEPALIIGNGESCSSELLNQLLKSTSLVIVLDSAMHRVTKLGIKVDVLLGDFDRDFDPEKYRNNQHPLEILHFEDQDSTDLDKAFRYLISRGITSANVIWATGKRADHTITNLTSAVKFKDQLKIVLWDDYSKVFLLPHFYQKWYPSKTPISLIPIGTVEGITTTNLDYPLHNESLILGYRSGSSNSVANDGMVTITYSKGDLLLMECND